MHTESDQKMAPVVPMLRQRYSHGHEEGILSNSQTTKHPPTRDAATILLVRDGVAGIEVFMLVRHTRLDFASGAMVFPGGAVDDHDQDPSLVDHVPKRVSHLAPHELSLRIAAIREAYEECGVFLARPRGADQLIDADRLALIDERYADARSQHNLDVGRVAREESMELACDLLIPFAHWITPTSQPKRFDTRFYIARTPDDQVAVHDGRESVDSVWMGPAEICKQADAGRWHVMFPTRINLHRLAMHDTVDSALEAAKDFPIVPVLPQLLGHSEVGRKLRIPPEAGYGVAEVIVSKNGAFRRSDI